MVRSRMMQGLGPRPPLSRTCENGCKRPSWPLKSTRNRPPCCRLVWTTPTRSTASSRSLCMSTRREWKSWRTRKRRISENAVSWNPSTRPTKRPPSRSVKKRRREKTSSVTRSRDSRKVLHRKRCAQTATVARIYPDHVCLSCPVTPPCPRFLPHC